MKTKKPNNNNKPKLPAADQYFVKFGNCLSVLHAQLAEMPAQGDSPVARIKSHLEEALNEIAAQLLANIEKREKAEKKALKAKN
jgi:hypothetical protein